MKKPSVTVLVTTKNDQRIIKMCVDSLLKQTYKNYKIYITVARTSTDKTYSILKKYGKKIKLERIDGNRPQSYNKMLANVNTDFVAFTDGDAVVDKRWLEILMDSFKPDIVAVGGMIRNPKSENKLQELVGRELEYRFSNLPKFVSRLPTMNLCVRTQIAKKEKFDESLRVAQETAWGYCLGGYGRIMFNPDAIVWHHHRSTWKAYLKQQYLYAQNVPKVYLNKRNMRRIGNDEISDISMPIQIGLMGLMFAFFLLGAWRLYLFHVSAVLFLTLLVMFTWHAIKLSKKITDVFYYIIIFFARTLAWTLGIMTGISGVF